MPGHKIPAPATVPHPPQDIAGLALQPRQPQDQLFHIQSRILLDYPRPSTDNQNPPPQVFSLPGNRLACASREYRLGPPQLGHINNRLYVQTLFILTQTKCGLTIDIIVADHHIVCSAFDLSHHRTAKTQNPADQDSGKHPSQEPQSTLSLLTIAGTVRNSTANDDRSFA